MRGYFVFIFSLVSLFFFAVLLFSTNSLFMFWLFLELGALCLVPLFFLQTEALNLSGLFTYLIVSGISSSMLVCGILFEDFVVFMVAGLLVKFGLFPFIGWVYSVAMNSNWYVVWALSTLAKCPFFGFSFFLSGVGQELIIITGVASFLVLSVLFWVYTSDWVMCWCHMMISSSVSLVVMSSWQGLDNLVGFFMVYLTWTTFTILFLSSQCGLELVGLGSVYLFLFFLVSLPFSLSMFYKFLLTAYMFSCPFLVFFFWAVYTISEQFFLLKLLIDRNVSRSSVGVLFYV